MSLLKMDTFVYCGMYHTCIIMIYNNDIYQRLSKVCHGIKFQNKFEYKIRPRGYYGVFNPLLRNVAKWSDIL